MRQVRLRDRVLIVGQTGMGKSTLAMFLARCLQPVRTVVIDPKWDYDFPGIEPVRSADALDMRPGWIHYVPEDADDRDELERFYARVWRTPGSLLLLDDEFAETSDSNWAAKSFTSQVRLGRKKDKGVIACTQRLAECHPIMRSQADHIFIVVPAPPDIDLRMLAGSMGKEWAIVKSELEAIEAEKGLYSHLWFTREGLELRRCEPLPYEASPWLPRGDSGSQLRPSSEHEPGRVDSPPCANSASPSGSS